MADANGSRIYALETPDNTIAQIIAENMKKKPGHRVAAFLCSQAKEGLKSAKSIFPTLAAQLARNDSKFLSKLEKSLQQFVRNQRLASGLSLKFHVNKFIVDPLDKTSSTITLIVIDALNECKEHDNHMLTLLQALKGGFSFEYQERGLKFLITFHSHTKSFRSWCSKVEAKHITISPLDSGSSRAEARDPGPGL